MCTLFLDDFEANHEARKDHWPNIDKPPTAEGPDKAITRELNAYFEVYACIEKRKFTHRRSKEGFSICVPYVSPYGTQMLYFPNWIFCARRDFTWDAQVSTILARTTIELTSSAVEDRRRKLAEIRLVNSKSSSCTPHINKLLRRSAGSINSAQWKTGSAGIPVQSTIRLSRQGAQCALEVRPAQAERVLIMLPLWDTTATVSLQKYRW